MSKHRITPRLPRVRLWLKRVTLALCLLAGLLVGGASLLLSPLGEPLLIRALAYALKDQGQVHVSFEHIRASGARSIHIAELSLTHQNGKKFLHLPDVALQFSLMQLLHGSTPLESITIPKAILYTDSLKPQEKQLDSSSENTDKELQTQSNGTKEKKAPFKPRELLSTHAPSIPKWLLAGHLRLNIDEFILQGLEMGPLAIQSTLHWNPIQQYLEVNVLEKSHDTRQPQATLRLNRHFDNLHLFIECGEWSQLHLLKNTPLSNWSQTQLLINVEGDSESWSALGDLSSSAPPLKGSIKIQAITDKGPAELRSSLELDPSLLLHANALELDTMDWEAKGNVDFNAIAKVFDINLEATPRSSEQLVLPGATLQSPQLRLELGGNLERYAGFIQFHAPIMTLHPVEASFLSPLMRVQIQGGKLLDTQFTVTADAICEDQPIHIRGEVNHSDGEWVMHSVRALSSGIELQADPSEDEQNPGWNLQATFDAQQSHLAQRLLKQAQLRAGVMQLFVHWKSDELDLTNPLTTLHFDATVEELAHESWRSKKINFTGSARLNPQEWSSSSLDKLSLQMQEVEDKKQPLIDELKASCWGSSSAIFFNAKAERSSQFIGSDPPYEVALEGVIDLTQQNTLLTLEEVHGSWDGLELKMPHKALFEISPHRVSCSDLDLDFAGGRLSVDSAWSKNQCHVKAQLNEVPVNLASLLIGRPLWGHVTGHVKMDVDEKGSLGDILLDLHDLRNESDTNLSSDTQGQISAHWVGPKLSAHVLLSTLGQELKIGLDGQWQAMLYPHSWKSLGLEQPHDVHLQLNGRLGLFSRLFLIEDFDFDGYTKASLRSWGTPLHPFLLGDLLVEHGSYDHYSIGLKLREISISAHGQEQTLVVDSLLGSDGQSGRFKAQGVLQLEGGIRSDSHLSLERFRLIDIPLATTWATGTAQFLHKGFRAKLQGEILLDSTQVRIPDLLPNPVPELDAYTIIRYPSEQLLSPSWIDPKLAQLPSKKSEGEKEIAIEGPSGVIALDLKVHLPEHVTLTGRGLNSNWKGQLHLTGHDEHVIIDGQIKLIDGDLLFGGRHFIMREGELDFAGSSSRATQIRIASELVLEQVTIRALLSGPLAHPKIQFKSTPNLSLADLFSHVLFGKAHNNLSAFQALQVAQLALETSGDSNMDLFTKLRQTTGVDRIEIESKPGTLSNSDEDVYALKLGKYIADGFLVGISKNVSTEGTQLTMELDLTNHLSLITEVGYLSESSINLMWKKDY